MTYTQDQAIELLQRAVAEKGDGHIYQKHKNSVGAPCRYMDDDGKPDCIVGHAFSYVGLLSPQLDGEGSVEFLKIVPENFTELAAASLEAAQRAQDNGATWGEALVAAKEATIKDEAIKPW